MYGQYFKTVEILNLGAFTIPTEAVQQGLLKVTKIPDFVAAGRFWAVFQQSFAIPHTIGKGSVLVFKQLQSEKFQRLHVVLGMVNDKDVLSLLELFPKQAQYYFCSPNVPRGLEASQLAQIFTEHGFEGSLHTSVKDALKAAKQNASKEDMIYIGGSTFVVAEII